MISTTRNDPIADIDLAGFEDLLLDPASDNAAARLKLVNPTSPGGATGKAIAHPSVMQTISEGAPLLTPTRSPSGRVIPIKVLLHVERRGDCTFTGGEWAGELT